MRYKLLVDIGCRLYRFVMDTIQHATALEAFAEAVRRAGNQTRFERATGAKQQKVSYWLKHGKVLPGEYVLKAERETGVSRHDLRPDLYPLEAAPSHDSDHGNTIPARRGDVACDRAAVLQRSARA